MDQQRVQTFVESLRRRQTNGSSAPGSTAAAPAARAREEPSAREDAAVFDPQALAKLGRLDLIARTVVDGFLSGKHRSTHKGGCTDFAEYRPYARGDDLRQLDWRLYARTDRYYVKRYDDETNLQALFIVDASGSMRFGMSTVTKWQYAQMTSACLAHLLLRQRDSVGLAVVGNRLFDYVKPLPRPTHLARLLDVLSTTRPHGQSALSDVLMEVSGRMKRRGMIVLFSDCFGDVAALKHVLEQFRYRGHDVMVMQILAPEELTFPFRRDAFFQDLESSRRMQVNPSVIRKQYLKEFQAFMDELHQATVDIGAELMTISTGDDLGEALAFQLRRRAAMKTMHGAARRA